MNITEEQAAELLELLGYVGEEVWGKTRTELGSRVDKIRSVLVEGLEDLK